MASLILGSKLSCHEMLPLKKTMTRKLWNIEDGTVTVLVHYIALYRHSNSQRVVSCEV